MRPVYFYGAMSLDGYLADDHDDLQWLFDTDLAGDSTYPSFEAKFDTLVMGRVTYDETRRLLGDAAFYPGKRKVVFTHAAPAPQPLTDFTADDPAAVVARLRRQAGGGIWIVGGGQLVATMLEAGLLTELWVQVAPVLLGGGKPLFPAGTYRQRLTLVDTTQMGELSELHFRVKRGTNGEN